MAQLFTDHSVSVVMGRRARTNCSPVDSVLEKYHSEIGNRLSGVFIPPPSAAEGGQHQLSEDFSMLTLDLRRSQSVKVRSQKSELTAQAVLKNSPVAETATATTTETPKAVPLRRSTMPRSASPAPTEAGSEVEGATRDKTRLVDKLTRALFQKKHVCARCKRKSRSCVLNKTLNVSEKRYTCGRCRENSSALKNFFDGHTGIGENQDASSFSSLSSSSSSNKPRAGNDSGYETVTSCSTVASSYSFNNNNNTNNTSLQKEDSDPSRIPNPQDSLSLSSGHHNYQTSDTDAGHQQQGCACQDGPEFRDCAGQFQDCHGDLRSMYGRHADYDGYLPDFIEFRGWTRQMLLRPCSQGEDPISGLADCGDDTDSCTESGPGGVICVRRPTSLDSSKPRPSQKACHTCGTTSMPCFRLPWEGGWLCEDCMDGIY